MLQIGIFCLNTPLSFVCPSGHPSFVPQMNVIAESVTGFLLTASVGFIVAIPLILWSCSQKNVLFIFVMSLGAKKGDRYILPAITALNAGVAYMVVVFQQEKMVGKSKVVGVFLLVLLAWQAVDVVRLTPYTLAYVNPVTRPFLGERRTGWGEGLDMAAEYLNGKSDAPTLKVASTYPNEFQYRFRGEAAALHKWEEASIDYAVVYRTSLQRGPDSWEQDVINHLQDRQPEKIIYLNSIPYAWIYRLH